MENMETIFKIGDEVYDNTITDCQGKVKYVCEVSSHVVVEFINGNNETYTLDGRIIDGYPKTLSFTPYTFEGFSQERPVKLPEIGSMFLFADNKEEFNNNKGCIGKLVNIEGKRFIDTDNIIWKFCKQIKIVEV